MGNLNAWGENLGWQNDTISIREGQAIYAPIGFFPSRSDPLWQLIMNLPE